MFCKKYNFKLYSAKYDISSKRMRWCGRLLSSKGIRFSPRRISGFQNMQIWSTGTHLQKFVCVSQYMRSSIPAFSIVFRPLSEFLEKIYKAARKRTLHAAVWILLYAFD